LILIRIKRNKQFWKYIIIVVNVTVNESYDCTSNVDNGIIGLSLVDYKYTTGMTCLNADFKPNVFNYVVTLKDLTQIPTQVNITNPSASPGLGKSPMRLFHFYY